MKRSHLKPVGARGRRDAASRAAFIRHVRTRCHVEGGFYRCEACGCLSGSIEAHHVRKRSLGGKHDPVNAMGVCHCCHVWIENHPLAAKEKGWSK